MIQPKARHHDSGCRATTEGCDSSRSSAAARTHWRGGRHRIGYVSNEHLADRSGARQRKIDVQTPTKVPVRVLANRPRCVRELKYIQRSTPRRVRATRRSSTCILAAVYLCCLLFCFLFSDGHGRPTEILRYRFWPRAASRRRIAVIAPALPFGLLHSGR